MQCTSAYNNEWIKQYYLGQENLFNKMYSTAVPYFTQLGNTISGFVFV